MISALRRLYSDSTRPLLGFFSRVQVESAYGINIPTLNGFFKIFMDEYDALCRQLHNCYKCAAIDGDNAGSNCEAATEAYSTFI